MSKVWNCIAVGHGHGPREFDEVAVGGAVDADDYGVWKANFGRVAESGGGGGGMMEIRSSDRPQGVGEEGTAEQVSSGTQAEPVVGATLALDSQRPALPGVLWTVGPAAKGDGAGANLRDELRREPSIRSAAVADRALVAWLAERRTERGGISEFLDARVCGSDGDENEPELAELFDSLNVAELVRI